jgi:hypothetical protein
VSIIRIQKLFVIGNSLSFISQTKKLAKDGCVITFLDNFIFILGAIHEKHKFKYFKNLKVTFCIIWWNDVYVYVYSSL